MLMVAIKNHNGATIKMLRDSHHKCLRSSGRAGPDSRRHSRRGSRYPGARLTCEQRNTTRQEQGAFGRARPGGPYIAFFMMIIAPYYDNRTIMIEFTLIFFTIMIKCRSHNDNCRPTLNLYFIMEFKLFASKF